MERLRVLVPVLRVSRYNNLEPMAVPPTSCVGELMVAPVPLPATIVAVLSMATPAMVAALTFTLNVTVQVPPSGTVILVTVNVPALKLKAGVVRAVGVAAARCKYAISIDGIGDAYASRGN